MITSSSFTSSNPNNSYRSTSQILFVFLLKHFLHMLTTFHLFVHHLIQANRLLDPNLVPRPRLDHYPVHQTLHLLYVPHLFQANHLLNPHLVPQPRLGHHFELFTFYLLITLFKLILMLIPASYFKLSIFCLLHTLPYNFT